MNEDEVVTRLSDAAGNEDPVYMKRSALKGLPCKRFPDDVRLGIGELRGGVTYIAWDGFLHRQEGEVVATVEFIMTRKYWYLPLNLEHYLSLVQRAVERRGATHGDVHLDATDDDGAYLSIYYTISGLPQRTANAALAHADKRTFNVTTDSA